MGRLYAENRSKMQKRLAMSVQYFDQKKGFPKALLEWRPENVKRQRRR